MTNEKIISGSPESDFMLEEIDFKRVKKIEDYAQFIFGSKAAFARSQGVTPQMVTHWIKKGYFVYKGKMYSLRVVRDLID